MKQLKFNHVQIMKLLENEHVVKCSAKSIKFSNEFKVFTVKQYKLGKTASQIFREAGLPVQLVGEHIPDNCSRQWRKKHDFGGEAGLLTDGRGSLKGTRKGRPTTRNMTDADKIKRLEIEVAYLKAKNDFLVKLRAQRKS